MSRPSRTILALLTILVLVVLLAQCEQESAPRELVEAKTEGVYLNHGDSAQYVGISVCAQCHVNIHKSFIHTGMGSSFGAADTAKSIGDFQGKSIYDDHLNLYYSAHWQGDTDLVFTEYRLRNGDTTHLRREPIAYVIGSGQHTNSHLLVENGFCYQAPLTWYAQKGVLDLPPGFEEGGNSRFARPIGLECMSCHNAMPTGFELGSYNRYKKIPEGIDCERCHGPGSIHVGRVSRGILVDTAQHIDYSIVNPAKLSAQLQFEICQRCHLQGNAVLADGASFFDFRPGMSLNSVMDVYLPRYAGQEDAFIMASHADRFKLSKCFIQTEGKFTCISCHNPHVSVRETKIQSFNAQCQNCHKGADLDNCSAPMADRKKVQDNCVSCHMPSSGSTDIPHVTVHDHYIRKPSSEKAQAIKRFLGLRAINNATPSPRSRILAYLQQYERFGGEGMMLDSAEVLLKQTTADAHFDLWVHYWSLRNAYPSLLQAVQRKGAEVILSNYAKQDYENRHAWLHYRIADAHYQLGRHEAAIPFYEKAVLLAPKLPNFTLKSGDNWLKLGRLAEAQKAYEKVLRFQPKNEMALSNLAYLNLRKGDYTSARKLLEKCLNWHPDYLQAWLNLAQLEMLEQNEEALVAALREVLRIDPQNPQALATLKQLKG